MKTKNTLLVIAAVVTSLAFAPAVFAETEPPPEEPPPEETVKGNNGWGNGPDTTNAGSLSGATASTKSINGLGVDKFDGKFDGR